MFLISFYFHLVHLPYTPSFLWQEMCFPGTFDQHQFSPQTNSRQQETLIFPLLGKFPFCCLFVLKYSTTCFPRLFTVSVTPECQLFGEHTFLNQHMFDASSYRLLGCGPFDRLWALRACLITSFTPFGRSGRVTHAPLHRDASRVDASHTDALHTDASHMDASHRTQMIASYTNDDDRTVSK